MPLESSEAELLGVQVKFHRFITSSLDEAFFVGKPGNTCFFRARRMSEDVLNKS